MQKDNFIHVLRGTHTYTILTLFHKLIIIVIVIAIVIDIVIDIDIVIVIVVDSVIDSDIVIVIIISLQRDAKSISNLNKFKVFPTNLNKFKVFPTILVLYHNGYHNIFQKY